MELFSIKESIISEFSSIILSCLPERHLKSRKNSGQHVDIT